MALVDYVNVQGLVRYGYGRMTEACFLFSESMIRLRLARG